MRLVSLSYFTLVLCILRGVQGNCSYRGSCQVVNGFPRPCVYDGPALSVTTGLTPDEEEEIIGILEDRCPHLLFDGDGNRLNNSDVVTCCSVEQIRDLTESLQLADSILGRCPRCLRNFMTHPCEMACSPEQSRFIDVIRSEVTSEGLVYVEEVNYRIYTDYMNATFDSCSGVVVPQTGLPAVNLMCGAAAVCDADAMFNFVGDSTANPLTPFQINFLRWNSTNDSMNREALSCDITDEDELPCSCLDCVAMCPVGNEPTIVPACTVLSINCIAFSVGICFFVITVTVFAILTLLEYKKYRKRVDSPSPVPDTKVKPQGNYVNTIFQLIFSKIGVFSANNTVLIFMFTSWITFVMFFGVNELILTTNPLELWSAPESRTRQHYNFFNTRFGPFYRPTQVFLRFQDLEPFEVGNVTYGPAFRFEAVRELLQLENMIVNIGREDGGVTLEDVCYAPLRIPGTEKLLDQCVTQSISVYLGLDIDNLNNTTYLNIIQNCINNHYSLDCLASWGGGSEPEVTFGGFQSNNILSADTLLITLPLTNHLLTQELQPTLEWEAAFINLLHDYETNLKSDFVQVAYGTERSIEDEIQRISNAEIVPIAISYLLMFVYVIIALGNKRYDKSCLVDSKAFVGFTSVIVVLIAIFCAIGVMGYMGYAVTLLAINVIPFFILSIGIDNVFLMVNTISYVEDNLKDYDDYKEDFTFEQKRTFIFSKMLGKAGPSMFVSSVTQITCFAVGTITNLPAVFTFAVVASVSLVFLFIFQVTTIVSILSLDYKRTSQNRVDVFCCIQTKSKTASSKEPQKNLMNKLIGFYTKFITNWKVKIIVAIFTMAMVFASILLIPDIEIGLDQEMALPSDSYVYRYLQAVSELLRLGPPVFFILHGNLNFTDPVHQNSICGGQLCYNDSLTTQIFLASQHSEITSIARSSNSWIDDFFDWTSLTGSCCKYNITDGSFCQSSDESSECVDCQIERDELNNGLRPSSEAYHRYIPFFLQDAPTDSCNKGGLASYSTNVNYILDSQGQAFVQESNFMAYHTPVSSSSDFINAVKYGYEISENITRAIRKNTGLDDIEVFPYSIFYVYFDQYLTMWRETFVSLGYCLIGALVINLVALGFNILTTLAVMSTVVMLVVTMMGVMYVWSIPLNPVSCINLIVSIGIAVEFCSHIAYAFVTSQSPPRERVEDALKLVGSTVITGITFTNIPIIVLAFSYTQIIEVFFFRMFFSVVLLGFFYGMVFFPVLLSFLNNLIITHK